MHRNALIEEDLLVSHTNLTRGSTDGSRFMIREANRSYVTANSKGFGLNLRNLAATQLIDSFEKCWNPVRAVHTTDAIGGCVL